MASRGGSVLLLLCLICAASAKHADVLHEKPDFKSMAKKMMMKCQEMGFQVPTALQSSVYGEFPPVEERKSDESLDPKMSMFVNTWKLVSEGIGKDSPDQVTMPNKKWNCTKLQEMIKQMKTSPEASACYMRALLVPVSWLALKTAAANDAESVDLEALTSTAEPAVLDLPPSRLRLPVRVKARFIEGMMKMMRASYANMSEARKARVMKWVKTQIIQNDFNCTMAPPAGGGGRADSAPPCRPSVPWLSPKAMEMMGPYLALLRPRDVDSSPKDKLCEFYQSAGLKRALGRVGGLNPSLSRRFLQRIQECYSREEEMAAHSDNLGPLVCYYQPPHLPAELSKKMLTELDNCDNPTARKVERSLVSSVMSNSSLSASDLGSSVAMLTQAQVSSLPDAQLDGILQTQGSKVKWDKGQLYALVKKKLGRDKCKALSGEELGKMVSLVEGLPRCALQRLRGRDVLEHVKNVSERMSRGQLKALLQGLRQDETNPSELVMKLPRRLLCAVALRDLRNMNNLENAENIKWCLPQAAYLAKKMYQEKRLKIKGGVRRLRWLMQGVTCRMIDDVTDDEVMSMAQAVTEAPECLSKMQAMCAARKLFVTLEKKRDNYFESITAEELNDIPPLMLMLLWPSKIKALPDAVCPVFLDKMEVADLNLVPARSPSRPALLQRALRCLAADPPAALTAEDVSELGQLVCEMAPSQLRLLTADVLRHALGNMAAVCRRIPWRHRAELAQLLTLTYGNPSDWSLETMEEVGPLLLLDDKATAALPHKPWMKDALYYLRTRLSNVSDSMRKKLFDVTVGSSSSSGSRRRRAVGVNGTVPSAELIRELGPDNVFWRASALAAMSEQTFLETVETLGGVGGFDAEQRRALALKVTEVFGPVSQLNETVLMQIGCISRNFSASELETLPFTLDTAEEIAHCDWTEPQLRAVWVGVAKHNNLTAAQLGAADMAAMGQFICGLSQADIQQLDKDAFQEAVGSLGNISCSAPVAQQLKTLTVAALGNVSAWSEAQVAELGNIIAGLDDKELASLDPSVFSFISSSAVPLIPAKNFAALSAAQLQALGPDNAEAVTAEQRSALSPAQADALNSSEEMAPRDEPESTVFNSQSGAPSLSVEGISALLKPLLVFGVGLLLL